MGLQVGVGLNDCSQNGGNVYSDLCYNRNRDIGTRILASKDNLQLLGGAGNLGTTYKPACNPTYNLRKAS